MTRPRRSGRSFLACALTALGLAACGTPEPVREMSEKTAVNVIFVSEQLKQLERESREVAALRAANIARLHRVNEEFRAEYDFDRALSEKVGDRNQLGELESWSEKVKKFHKDLDEIEQKKQQEIEAARIMLANRSKELAVVAEKLAVLAEEESFKNRAKFLAGFFKEVGGEVKARLDKGDESAKKAKAGLDALKAKLSKGLPKDKG